MKILACIIHELRLPQMRGVAHEVVLVHHEWAATKQMWEDRLARRVKTADIGYKLANKQSDVRDIAENHAIKLISLKINEGVGSFYE